MRFLVVVVLSILVSVALAGCQEKPASGGAEAEGEANVENDVDLPTLGGPKCPNPPSACNVALMQSMEAQNRSVETASAATVTATAITYAGEDGLGVIIVRATGRAEAPLQVNVSSSTQQMAQTTQALTSNGGLFEVFLTFDFVYTGDRAALGAAFEISVGDVSSGLVQVANPY